VKRYAAEKQINSLYDQLTVIRTSAFRLVYISLLQTRASFTGNYASRIFQAKLHLRSECDKDIADAIPRFFRGYFCEQLLLILFFYIYIIKIELHGGLNIPILFSRFKNGILLTHVHFREILF